MVILARLILLVRLALLPAIVLPALVLPFAALAAAQDAPPQGVGPPAVAPRDARLSVEVERTGTTPYVGEMVLVTVRGTYDVTIALEKLVQPDLKNFGWIQLGHDSWTHERIDGRDMTVFERRLALYPRRAGTLPIGSFVHQLTLLGDGGGRFVHDVASPPVTLDVAPKPRTDGDWWLPARSVTLEDHWSTDPGHLANDETARRTVRITAVGVMPNALPPPPKMVGKWLIAFMVPEERKVELTKDGPISTVVWRWRMRPSKSEPGRLKAFHIPWFDTRSREMREVVLKSQRLAYAAVDEASAAAPAPSFAARYGDLFAGGAGLVLCLALLLPGRRLLGASELAARARRRLPDPARWQLRLAAWRGDAPAMRAAAMRLRRSRPPDRAAIYALARLDRQVYGREASERLDLRPIARTILARPRRRRSGARA